MFFLLPRADQRLPGAVSGYLLFDRDRDLLRLGLLGLRQGDGQDAIVVGGRDLVGVNLGRQADRAMKAAQESLRTIGVGGLEFLVLFAFAGDNQKAIVKIDVDVLLFHAGQFGADRYGVLVLIK